MAPLRARAGPLAEAGHAGPGARAQRPRDPLRSARAQKIPTAESGWTSAAGLRALCLARWLQWHALACAALARRCPPRARIRPDAAHRLRRSCSCQPFSASGPEPSGHLPPSGRPACVRPLRPSPPRQPLRPSAMQICPERKPTGRVASGAASRARAAPPPRRIQAGRTTRSTLRRLLSAMDAHRPPDAPVRGRRGFRAGHTHDDWSPLGLPGPCAAPHSGRELPWAVLSRQGLPFACRASPLRVLAWVPAPLGPRGPCPSSRPTSGECSFPKLPISGFPAPASPRPAPGSPHSGSCPRPRDVGAWPSSGSFPSAQVTFLTKQSGRASLAALQERPGSSCSLTSPGCPARLRPGPPRAPPTRETRLRCSLGWPRAQACRSRVGGAPLPQQGRDPDSSCCGGPARCARTSPRDPHTTADFGSPARFQFGPPSRGQRSPCPARRPAWRCRAPSAPCDALVALDFGSELRCRRPLRPAEARLRRPAGLPCSASGARLRAQAAVFPPPDSLPRSLAPLAAGGEGGRGEGARRAGLGGTLTCRRTRGSGTPRAPIAGFADRAAFPPRAIARTPPPPAHPRSQGRATGPARAAGVSAGDAPRARLPRRQGPQSPLCDAARQGCRACSRRGTRCPTSGRSRSSSRTTRRSMTRSWRS